MGIEERYCDLPVSSVATEVCRKLDKCPRILVTAPPGAGKSTLLPLVLMEYIPEGKILMLEPRRIAARQVSSRMASMLGESPGGRVGYRVRFETAVSAATRLEVITEGVLEKMLVEDSTLEGVAAVIFDEFHERSLTSDLTLALVRETQNLIRPDLRIVLMSATVESQSICRALDAGFVSASGRMHEVDTVYCGDFDIRDTVDATARVTARAWRERQGDILVFLPGQAEIERCAALVEASIPQAEVKRLYGLLAPRLQQEVLLPSTIGKRRIIFSSPVAETSLTIPGIRTVVDSGLHRSPQFDPDTGLTRLVTNRISMDMAVQRSGRAGRLESGTCYRMWSKAAESRMAPSRIPEVLSADLSQAVLTVGAWGESDMTRLPWLTMPPKGHVSLANDLLRRLGAVDEKGRITPAGKKMGALPCHPRISRMLLEAGTHQAAAADIAALIEEKDPCSDTTDADICTRLLLLEQYRHGKMPPAWARIDKTASQYKRMAGIRGKEVETAPGDIGRLVALAYPERIAMRGDDGKYRLAGGLTDVVLDDSDALGRHRMLAVASVGKRIYSAAPLRDSDAASLGSWRHCARWDSRQGRVTVREELRIGALIVDTRAIVGDTRELALEAIAAAAPKEGLTMFDFNDEVRRLQRRIELVASWHPDLGMPDMSASCLLARVREWLPMYGGNARSVQELRKIDLCEVIRGLLPYPLAEELDAVAPARMQLPGGRSVKIDYRDGTDIPVVSARLQDCFGMTDTPAVDRGRRRVLMELLSPGFKPVQLTQDLAGFWKNTYFDVRKELKRRYPKHRWPDDPS